MRKINIIMRAAGVVPLYARTLDTMQCCMFCCLFETSMCPVFLLDTFIFSTFNTHIIIQTALKTEILQLCY